MSKPILEVRKLTKTYGDNIVFHDIDITVNEGDTDVIIGPSGTGKSTLLRCINLLTKADSGQIWLDRSASIENITLYRWLPQIIMLLYDFP